MAALWDLRCEDCGAEALDVSCSVFALPPCASCGRAMGLFSRAAYHPFIPYFDIGLGKEIASLAERRTAMRGHIDEESGIRRGQMDYRDKMSKGALSARADRLHEGDQRQARHDRDAR